MRGKYGIKEIKLFGSYLKGEQNETSDVDIIVSFEEQPTLIELLKIERELEKLLDVKVGLLTEEEISPYIAIHKRNFNSMKNLEKSMLLIFLGEK